MAIDAAAEDDTDGMMSQLSAGCFPCLAAAGDDNMESCFPDGSIPDQDLPACVATCNFDDGNCPTDCDTSACPTVATEGYDGDNPKEGIDAYLAGGCQDGDDEEGPPACVAACDFSAGCPTDCDTAACPTVATEGYDGDNPKEGIDAYLAAGCQDGDDEEGPPACVAACDFSAGCPADCDTSACPTVPTEGYDGDNPKEGIDAYLAGGCQEGDEDAGVLCGVTCAVAAEQFGCEATFAGGVAAGACDASVPYDIVL
jgi:hypothetical protein